MGRESANLIASNMHCDDYALLVSLRQLPLYLRTEKKLCVYFITLFIVSTITLCFLGREVQYFEKILHRYLNKGILIDKE